MRIPACKERELYYCSHLDYNVFSYYTEILSKFYEAKLRTLGISECVTAYRRVRLDPANPLSRNKCNIDFASDVFTYIKNNPAEDLIAVTFDIKGFFDSINHKKLKQSWRKVIDSGLNLPPDHYNLYFNITRFSFIEERELFNVFREAIIVKREPKLFKRKRVAKRKYLRNQRAVAFCLQKELPTLRKMGYIKSNKWLKNGNATREIRTSGIPQGSPISSILANMYMLDFDVEANKFICGKRGIYRRYSDDMVVVCPPEYEAEVIKFFHENIAHFKLKIQSSKTQIFHFKKETASVRFQCWEKNIKTGKLSCNTKFEYLGFQFDGFYTLLKSSSIASYYRKMKRAIRRGRFYSIFNKTESKGELFKNRLYKRYTHLGAHRRRLYKRDNNDPSKFYVTEKYDWGNYLSYVYLADRIIPDSKIKRQMRKHRNKFHQLLAEIPVK